MKNVNRSDIELKSLRGDLARTFINELAELRIKVFYDYPYLYEGSVDYEKKYLETYFNCQTSVVIVACHEGKIIGASTALPLIYAEESLVTPWTDQGFNPREIFYYGESVLLYEYRGLGLGKAFFESREAAAKKVPEIKWGSFCAVVRPENHPLRPKNYRSLDTFWTQQGYEMNKNIQGHLTWPDRGEDKATIKEMQFWMKRLV